MGAVLGVLIVLFFFWLIIYLIVDSIETNKYNKSLEQKIQTTNYIFDSNTDLKLIKIAELLVKLREVNQKYIDEINQMVVDKTFENDTVNITFKNNLLTPIRAIEFKILYKDAFGGGFDYYTFNKRVNLRVAETIVLTETNDFFKNKEVEGFETNIYKVLYDNGKSIRLLYESRVNLDKINSHRDLAVKLSKYICKEINENIVYIYSYSTLCPESVEIKNEIEKLCEEL